MGTVKRYINRGLIERLEVKERLDTRNDFHALWLELAAINPHAADAFRDAIWHKDGKWHGVGVGNISVQEVIEYALELERMALAGEEFELLEYKISK